MNPTRPLLPREFVLAHKRLRILEAVAELSAEQGYEAMTISDIVTRAGIARKTLYENYDGKEEVFLATVDAAFEAVRERVEAACVGQGDWRGHVDAALSGLLDHLAEHPAEAHMLILEAPGATPASAARCQAALERFTSLLSDATPATRDPGGTIEEGIVGGVVWILNRRLRYEGGGELRDLGGDLSAFVLAPWA